MTILKNRVWLRQWGRLFFWSICFGVVVVFGIWLPVSQGRHWFGQRVERNRDRALWSRTQQDQHFWKALRGQTEQWHAQLQQDLKPTSPQHFLPELERITQKHALRLLDLHISDAGSEAGMQFSWQGPWQASMTGLYDLETLAVALRVTELHLKAQDQGVRAHISLVFWRDDEAI